MLGMTRSHAGNETFPAWEQEQSGILSERPSATSVSNSNKVACRLSVNPSLFAAFLLEIIGKCRNFAAVNQ
jgi:hypothetical protein